MSLKAIKNAATVMPTGVQPFLSAENIGVINTNSDIINIRKAASTKGSSGFLISETEQKTEIKNCIGNVMLNSVLSIKIHTNLLPTVIQDRHLRQKYQTNKIIKNVGFYYILKAIAPNSIIKDYRAQLFDLCEKLGGISVPTFYSLLKGCEALGYLKRGSKNIILSPYKAFSATFGTEYSAFTVIKYDFKKHKINHVLETAYLQLMEKDRERILNSKINANEYLKQDLNTIMNPDHKGSWQPALKVMQLNTLMFGHPKQYAIFCYNADLGLNERSLRDRFNFKSSQSVSYLKIKLSNNKLLSVTKQRIPSTVQVNKDNRIKRLYTEWDSKTKQVIYVLPDKLDYAPIL